MKIAAAEKINGFDASIVASAPVCDKCFAEDLQSRHIQKTQDRDAVSIVAPGSPYAAMAQCLVEAISQPNRNHRIKLRIGGVFLRAALFLLQFGQEKRVSGQSAAG